MPADKVIILILLSILWAAFCWWSVKRLWRPPKDPNNKDEARHVQAVKIYSVAFAVITAVTVPMNMPMPPLTVWQQAGIFLVYSFPFWLWTGHISFSMFRAFSNWYYS